MAVSCRTFITDLVSARIGYSFSNMLFLNGLLQYNSDTGEISSNVRFNMIYRPLSDLFVVYNERQTRDGRVLERALIAKLTYLLAF